MIDANTLISLLPVLLSIKNLSILSRRNKIKASAKHIVITSDNAVQDFLNGDIERLKGPRTESIYFNENEIFKFAKQIYRPSFKWGNSYQKWEETPIWQEGADLGGSAYRKLDKITFENEIKKNDPLVFRYVENTFDEINDEFNFSEFLRINYYEEVCGGYEIDEFYEFKPIFIVALWIENLDEEPLKLKSYEGNFYYPHDDFEFRKESWGFGEKIENELPQLSLKKGESLLVPELLLLGEIKDSGNRKPFLKFYGEMSDIFKFDIYSNPNKLVVFGPSISIEKLNFERESLRIHTFNSSNVLRLSKDFACGSCPFLFGFNGEKFIFIKEILANSFLEEIEFLNFEYLIIAELKDEISYFNEIRLVSDFDEPITLYNNVKLEEGQYILIKFPKNGDYNKLIIKGFYQTRHEIVKNTPEIICSKRRLIDDFNINDLEIKKI